MAMTTTQISNLLRPGLAAICGDYPTYPTEWSEIYETYESDKAFEIEEEMKFLGIARFRDEGAPTPMDTMGQRFATTYQHRYLALMFNITRQAQLDNLYKQKFPMIAKSFKRSFLIAKETLGAAVLNNGFTTQLTGDGQPLFSTAHIIDTGTVANRPTTGSDMNETSWESGLIQVAFFKDIAGNPTQAKVVKLIVPPQLEYVACRLTKSAFRTNTPNNDISATYHIGSAPEGYRVNHYLSSGSAWFMLTDSPNGFKMYQREPFQTDTYVDFLTDNIQCKGLERYSFGVTNWRAGWGNPGQ